MNTFIPTKTANASSSPGAGPDTVASVIPPVMDRETRAVLHWVSSANSGKMSDLSPRTARDNYRRSLAQTDIPAPAVGSIENIMIRGQGGDVGLRIYRPLMTEGHDAGTDLPAILFIHGGGCIMGDLETHEPLCCSLCADTGAIVIAVDYRLAPEHRFPAPIEDAISALTWLDNNTDKLGIDPRRVAIAGDSAGGGIATVAIHECQDTIILSPCAQLLIYPAVDVCGREASRTELSGMFPVTADTLEWFFNHYFGTAWPLHDARAHPMNYTDFSGMPPTLIMTAGFDPLKDEALAYGKKLENDGVQTEYKTYNGTIHGFLGMGRLLRNAHRAARSDIATFLKKQFRQAG